MTTTVSDAIHFFMTKINRVSDHLIEVGKHQHMATTAAVQEKSVAFDAAALTDGSYSEGDPGKMLHQQGRLTTLVAS